MDRRISPRIPSIDLLRGLAMVLMALDHVRDFFHVAAFRFDPTDLLRATPGLFLTRWVTHLCAPIFVLLAGVGAYLALARGRSKPSLAFFLLTRGLWLVLLELTVVKFGWDFGLDYHFVRVQVIWALGWSMVALAGLIWLPTGVVGGLGILLIAGHNLLDRVYPGRFGPLAPLWSVLHVSETLILAPGYRFDVLYPLIPWIGVLAAGYALGALLLTEPGARRRLLLRLGLGLSAAFIALRAVNLYGDPRPWSAQGGPVHTILSFINCEKYPPSLLYLLMTLGPALLLLGLFEGHVGRLARPLVTLGRVPLFYYLIHLPLIQALSVVIPMIGSRMTVSEVLDHGLRPYELPGVYLVWLGVVLALYPLCAWFARVKQRNPAWWLSYL